MGGWLGTCGGHDSCVTPKGPYLPGFEVESVVLVTALTIDNGLPP